jgi:putative ATP-dependent endonuclease of the OLD family
MSLEKASLKAKNLKCFGDTACGFDQIKPINIAIGRNNSGKSTLLDLLEHAITQTSIKSYGHLGHEPEIYFELPLDDDLIEALPTQNVEVQVQGGTINIDLHLHAENRKGKPIRCHRTDNGQVEFDRFVDYTPHDGQDATISNSIVRELLRQIVNPFRGYTICRLAADRDVVPEARSSAVRGLISSNGSGATNAIRAYLLMHDLKSDLIEVEFLNALNEILRPDTNFSRILVRERELEGKIDYEIYLVEEKKGSSIPMSRTGSGIKTVILVLTRRAPMEEERTMRL